VDQARHNKIVSFIWGIADDVLRYTPDAWINNDAGAVGNQISFPRHFYKSRPLRRLAEIIADLLAIEREADGLLDGLLMIEVAP